MDMRPVLLVRVGVEGNFGHTHLHARPAARLRRVGGNLDREGNEPLEGDELLPAQREKP